MTNQLSVNMSYPEHPSFQFWGLRGIFSATVLATLLDAGIRPEVLIVPTAYPGEEISRILPPKQPLIPIIYPIGSTDIIQQAWTNQIPVWGITDLNHPQTKEILEENRPELAIVACYNQRIPGNILDIPHQGFLNIHPSLLPAFRGPAPLFWLLREAATTAMGITLHKMDADLDTGDIVNQVSLRFPDGVSGTEINQICARAGAQLLIKLLKSVARGQMTTRKQGGGASYFPWPKPTDFTLNTNWSAKRAFNFMRATAEWQMPYPLSLNDQTIILHQAISFSEELPPWPYRISGQQVWIRFRPGTLHAQLV